MPNPSTQAPTKRSSAEVFATWQSLRANGFTVEIRNRQQTTYLCAVCGSNMPVGTRMYAKVNSSGKVEAAIDYYPETCQAHAAPGDFIHHEPMTVIKPPTYTRNTLPSAPNPTPRYFTVDKPTPPAAPPKKQPKPYARTLPFCRFPAPSHGEGLRGGVAPKPYTRKTPLPLRQGERAGDRGAKTKFKPIAPDTLSTLWQCTHLITSGRVEFNDYCKRAGYLKSITGRDVKLPEELSDSEGQLVITQIRADALKVAPAILQRETDIIGEIAMGHNSWACVNHEIIARTGGRTELYTRMYADEMAEWRKQLELGLTAEQHAEVAIRLSSLRHEALASAIA